MFSDSKETKSNPPTNKRKATKPAAAYTASYLTKQQQKQVDTPVFIAYAQLQDLSKECQKNNRKKYRLFRFVLRKLVP